MKCAFSLAKQAQSSFVVGDYNFDSSFKDEENVITECGMRDEVHKFYGT